MAVSYPDTPGVLRYFDTYRTSLTCIFVCRLLNVCMYFAIVDKLYMYIGSYKIMKVSQVYIRGWFRPIQKQGSEDKVLV